MSQLHPAEVFLPPVAGILSVGLGCHFLCINPGYFKSSFYFKPTNSSVVIPSYVLQLYTVGKQLLVRGNLYLYMYVYIQFKHFRLHF